MAPSVTQQDEITFAAPVVGPQTKTVNGEIGTTYNESETFGVYAVHTQQALSTWAMGTTYMGTSNGVGLECLKNTHENYWAPTTPYYWPKEGYLSFAAYSPYGVSGTVTYSSTGLSVANHTVDSDISKSVDFMYAPRVYNRNSSTEEGDDNDAVYKYDGVNILFEHAMSSIVFTVKKADDIDVNTKITLTGITLTKPYLKADFNETVTDGATYSAVPAWSNWGSNKDDITIYENTAGAELTTTSTEYVKTTDGTAHDIILIPQTLTDDVKVLLNYTITNPGNHTISQVSETMLNTYTTAWGMGTRYTYNITIGLEEVIFDPAVTAWKDNTASEITF